MQLPKFTPKSFTATLVVAGLVIFTAVQLFSSNGQNLESQVAAEQPILPVETIWPAVANKTLARQKVEYRPTGNPHVYDTYCIHHYTDGAYVHQYVGKTDGINKPTCS